MLVELHLPGTPGWGLHRLQDQPGLVLQQPGLAVITGPVPGHLGLQGNHVAHLQSHSQGLL